jgi:hypothetical protein
MKRCLNYLTFFSVFVLLSGIAPSLLAQPPSPGGGGFGGFGPGDGSRIIQKLNRALGNAGTAELSDAQEADIETLIQEHRENRPGRDPGNLNTSLFKEYGEAILNGDAETAKGIAVSIAELMVARTAERMQVQADFQVALLDILEGPQLEALLQQYGDQGVLRLLGRPGRMGPAGKRGDRGAGFPRQGKRGDPEAGVN